MAMNAQQVRAAVRRLEDKSSLKTLRTKSKDRLDLVTMQLPASLPTHYGKGVSTDEPTPILIKMTNEIVATLRSYPIRAEVTAFESGLQKEQDEAEKWTTLIRMRLDEGKRVSTKTYKQQCIRPFTVWFLRCGSPDEECPWEVEVYDETTCYCELDELPMRPTRIARHYKQSVRDIVNTFSGRKNWDGEGWKPNGKKYKWADGKWGFDGVGQQVAPDAENTGDEDMIDVMELHDEDMIYILAMNKGQRDGELVWVGKSMTDGVSAVVIPSEQMPLDEPWLKYQPVLWPEMQMAYLINQCRAQRATRSNMLRPDVLIGHTPEELQSLQAAGIITPVTNAQALSVEAGGPTIIDHAGKATLWTVQPDLDLDKREISYWTEMNSYRNARTITSQPEVIKDSNTNVFLTYAEGQHLQESVFLDPVAWAWKAMLDLVWESVPNYKKDFPLHATQDMEYGSGKQLKKGDQATIGPDQVDKKKFYISVTIRSTSEAEQRMRTTDAAYREGIGVGTHLQTISASGVQDETRQVEEIAVDAAFKLQAPQITQEIAIATMERIDYRQGILITLAGVPAPAPQQQPTGQQPYPTPATGSAQGAA